MSSQQTKVQGFLRKKAEKFGRLPLFAYICRKIAKDAR
jgi:hypothetical protein